MIEIHPADELILRILPPQKPQEGICYVPSRFVLPFAHEGASYTVNLLTKQCIKATLPESALASEGFDELIESYFLVPKGKDECAFYNSLSSVVRSFNRKDGISEFTITTTLACNARCIYCYEEGMKPVAMTPGVVDQTIRYIMANRRGGTVKLSWFGGEPLLRPDIIDRVCEAMQKAGIAYESHMISNGSLVTPEIVDKMVGLWKLDHLQISMDGAEPDYILRKHYYVDKDQYHAVLRGIRLMSDAGIRVKVRCNVDEDNIERFPEFLNDLLDCVQKRELLRVYLAPLFQVRTGPGSLSFWKKLLDIRADYEAKGIILGGMSGFSPRFTVNNCLADGNGVVIHPDGSLYACEQFPSNSRFGDVWNGVTDPDAKHAFCRTDITREECRNCAFLPVCTSFASCGVREYRCREMHELLTVYALRRLVSRKSTIDPADFDIPSC